MRMSAGRGRQLRFTAVGSPYLYSPDGRWYWNGASWIAVAQEASGGPGPGVRAPAPGALPHLPGLMQLARQRRSNQVQVRVVVVAMALAFGLYVASTLWQLVPLLALGVGGVVVTNGLAGLLGILQSRPHMRVLSEGVWIRSVWRPLPALRLVAGLLGAVAGLGCALALWWAGLAFLGAYFVVASLVNLFGAAAQPVPVVRLVDGTREPRRVRLLRCWIFVPWQAVRQVHSSQHFGLLSGITLDVDPAHWPQLLPTR